MAKIMMCRKLSNSLDKELTNLLLEIDEYPLFMLIITLWYQNVHCRHIHCHISIHHDARIASLRQF